MILYHTFSDVLLCFVQIKSVDLLSKEVCSYSFKEE